MKKSWKFDKTTGYCYRGKFPETNLESSDTCILLPNIHAVQITSEWIPGKNSFVSYEINLVLKDYSRINIIDHSYINRIREDAQTIGQFLGVPVWDVTV